MEKKTIGIVGGMGPLATVDLFRKIVVHTKAACDQDHLRILIENDPGIEDRTAALLCSAAARSFWSFPATRPTASLTRFRRRWTSLCSI